jgi:hypothetical protein
MWQEVVASSFQPGVKRGWDQGSSAMVDQSMSEMPLFPGEHYRSFLPTVEQGWDQGSSSMVGQSMSEIPLFSGEDNGNFGFGEFHNDSLSLDTTGDVPAELHTVYTTID